MNRLRRVLGKALASFLTREIVAEPTLPVDIASLSKLLHKADVILVEGHLRISMAVKYLTQSTWSHAALYAGNDECIEADVLEGVRRFPIADLASYRIRICRPISLTPADADIVIAHAASRLGVQYDLKHVVDLARYLLPFPMPSRWRRRALALGSADPSRAICSTLVAESFQSAFYPILPDLPPTPHDVATSRSAREIHHIHNTGLFTPRDFDLSPFFHVIKPDMPRPFDHHNLIWMP